MTQARIITTPPEGHGITGRMLDRLYAELTSGKNMGENMLVVGIVAPVSTSQRRTAKGVKRFVGFEFLRLEPITDMSVAEDVRFALVKAYERRTSGSRQLPLEFEGAPELEKRREIFAALDEWRSDQEPEVTPSELTEIWRDYVQPVEGAAVPAIAHADTASILAFAYHIGALMPEKLAGMEALPTDDERPQAVRPVPEVLFDDGTGEVPEGKCQTCRTADAVVDGLCATHAKEVGLRVPAEPGSVEEAAEAATEARADATAEPDGPGDGRATTKAKAEKGLRAV